MICIFSSAACCPSRSLDRDVPNVCAIHRENNGWSSFSNRAHSARNRSSRAISFAHSAAAFFFRGSWSNRTISVHTGPKTPFLDAPLEGVFLLRLFTPDAPTILTQIPVQQVPGHRHRPARNGPLPHPLGPIDGRKPAPGDRLAGRNSRIGCQPGVARIWDRNSLAALGPRVEHPAVLVLRGTPCKPEAVALL